MKIWARVGISLEVEEATYNESPKRAIAEALSEGRWTLDGETYVPSLFGEEVTVEF